MPEMWQTNEQTFNWWNRREGTAQDRKRVMPKQKHFIKISRQRQNYVQIMNMLKLLHSISNKIFRYQLHQMETYFTKSRCGCTTSAFMSQAHVKYFLLYDETFAGLLENGNSSLKITWSQFTNIHKSRFLW